MTAEEPGVGDVAVFSLLLQVLQSTFSNRFFDFDFSLKTVIPVLMNLTLFQKFNKLASVRSLINLKDKNAALLSSLIERFHQKYELKVGYANFLLKHLLSENTHPLASYGCISCLGKFGPHLTKKILLPHVAEIV